MDYIAIHVVSHHHQIAQKFRATAERIRERARQPWYRRLRSRTWLLCEADIWEAAAIEIEHTIIAEPSTASEPHDKWLRDLFQLDGGKT